MPDARSRAADANFAGLGDVGVHTPIEMHQDRASLVMVVFFALLVGFVVAGLWIGYFAKQEPVRGYVTAASGMTRLVAPQPGTVSAIAVKQGDRVAAGQLLATIKTQQVATRNETTLAMEQDQLKRRRDVNLAEVEKLDALIAALSKDRQTFADNHKQLLDSIAAQERDLRKAKANDDEFLARMSELVKTRDITRERYLTHERAAQASAQQLSELIARRTQLVAEHVQRMNALEAAIADKSSQRAALVNDVTSTENQLNYSEAQAVFHLVASTAGVVASIPVIEGASIEAQQPIVVLADPDADQMVVLDVPAKSMGLVNEGQRVMLKYDAFPFKTFGVKAGTVVSVAQAPMDTFMTGKPSTELPAAARIEALARQTTFRILVRPDGKTFRAYGEERPIALGSTLTADIVIEKRRLIDWVIDPILALQGRS